MIAAGALVLVVCSLILNWRLAGSQSGSTSQIYWADKDTNKIQRANIADGVKQDLVASGLSGPDGIALDLANNKMYWVDWDIDKIQRANLDGTGVQDLITTGLVVPESIALDLTNRKMYWTDSTLSVIGRANLDGSGRESVISTGLMSPEGIALDVGAGKIYWVDWGSLKIQRANLDGTGVQDLITSGLTNPQGLALDIGAGKMYWTDASANQIRRANLDGTGAETLAISGVSDPRGIEVDTSTGKIYWSNAGSGAIRRANLNGSAAENVVTGLIGPRGVALALVRDTPTPTFTFTPTNTPTNASTHTPTNTPTNTPTETPSNTPITDTPPPQTGTPVTPTDTPIPPTATPVPPTATPVPPTATNSPTPEPTGTPLPLPDLFILAMKIESEIPQSCAQSPGPLGVRITIANNGSGGAGSFVVDANGQQATVAAGLAANAQIDVWIALSTSGNVTAVVDPTNQIAESNEANNTLSQLLPVPTPVPTCTPTGVAMFYLPAIAKMPPVTPTPIWQLLGAPAGDFTQMAIRSNGDIFVGHRKAEGKYAGGLFQRSLVNCDIGAPLIPSTSLPTLDASVLDVDFQGSQGVVGAELEAAQDIFYTSNGGISWTQSQSVVDRPRTIAIVNNENWYVGTESGGIYRSADQGISWNFVTDKPSEINIIKFNSTLWIGDDDDTANGGGGVSVLPVGSNQTVLRNNGLNSDSSRTVWDFAFGNNGQIYLATFNGVYFYDSNGFWVEFGVIPDAMREVRSLELVNETLYAGTDSNGVWRRSLADGSRWQSTGIQNVKVRDLLYDDQYCRGLLAATDQGVWLFAVPVAQTR